MPRQHIEHQSTADMGRPPGGTPAQFFCTVSAACAVCLPVLCVCDVWSLGRTCAGTSPNAVTPHPPSQDVSLLCSDVLISYYRAPSCTNRRSLSYQSHSIWHSGTDLISQHLVLTSVTASRTDLAASRTISHHLAPIAAASRTDLAAFGTDLAASRIDLAPSRTDLAPSA